MFFFPYKKTKLFFWNVFNFGLYCNNFQNEYKNLFKFPQMANELDEIATDSNGKTKHLNKKQLDDIKKEG